MGIYQFLLLCFILFITLLFLLSLKPKKGFYVFYCSNQHDNMGDNILLKRFLFHHYQTLHLCIKAILFVYFKYILYITIKVLYISYILFRVRYFVLRPLVTIKHWKIFGPFYFVV